MEMTPVTSSQIARVGYDKEREILLVEFKTNKTYQYADVPLGVYEELLTTDSVGGYFNKNVKTKFQYKLIG